MSSKRQRERIRQRKVAYMEALRKSQQENDRTERLEKMTKAELVEYAEDNGIKVDKTAKKAEILEKIKE